MSDRSTDRGLGRRRPEGSWIELPAPDESQQESQDSRPYRPRLDYGNLAGVKVVGGRDGVLDTYGGSGP